MKTASVKIGQAQLGELDRRVLEEALDLYAAVHRGQLGLVGQQLEVSAAGTPFLGAAKAARRALDDAEAQMLPVASPWPLGATGEAGPRAQRLAAMVRMDAAGQEEASRAIEAGLAGPAAL